jgi:hypothetical protein
MNRAIFKMYCFFQQINLTLSFNRQTLQLTRESPNKCLDVSFTQNPYHKLGFQSAERVSALTNFSKLSFCIILKTTVNVPIDCLDHFTLDNIWNALSSPLNQVLLLLSHPTTKSSSQVNDQFSTSVF